MCGLVLWTVCVQRMKLIKTLIGTDLMSVVSHVLGEDLKMVQRAASFTESKEQPHGSRWLVRGEGGTKTRQEETSEEEHDDGVSEASALKCVKEVGF